MYINIIGYTARGKVFRKSATYNTNFCNIFRKMMLQNIRVDARDLNTAKDFDDLQYILSELKPYVN